jgi:Bacterial PH domain
MRTVIARYGRWRRMPAVIRALTSRITLVLALESPSRATWPAEPFMLPHERMVVAVRKHPGMLTGPFGLLAAVLVAASLITAGVIPGDATVLAIGWGAGLVVLLCSLAATAAWYSMFLTVTNMRLITIRGRKTKKVFTVSLAEADDFIFVRSALGRIVGYGTFIVISPGPGHARHKMTYLPYPEQLYLEVCGLLYPDLGDG